MLAAEEEAEVAEDSRVPDEEDSRAPDEEDEEYSRDPVYGGELLPVVCEPDVVPEPVPANDCEEGRLTSGL
jgi:hypothetical protein